jgi:dTDP-4-dehydrorhamnose reductase
MRILILGSTGMLGNAVGKYFLQTGHNITLTYRNKDVAFGTNKLWFDAAKGPASLCLGGEVGIYDYVINCIGTIKPFMATNPRAARYLNAVFPWDLANWCEERGSKLIHITTDCVYSGNKGNYIESDVHDALDDYGKSKSLGEPTNALVIRTSIVGEEIHKNASLIEWAKSQKGKEVKGFTTHWWNGITTTQFAKVCEKIMENDLWKPELYHVFSPTAVNKYELMQYFNERFDLDLKIIAFEASDCNRSLYSSKDLCKKLNIPELKEQILTL